MFNFDYHELHSLHGLCMLISIKRIHPFFPFVEFPVQDVAKLHDFAREFVIGFFEIEPANNARLSIYQEMTEDGEAFLARMYEALVNAVGQELADAVIAWNQKWSFYGRRLGELAMVWDDVVLPLKERKPTSLIEACDRVFLQFLDLIVDGYFNRTEPILTALEGMEQIPDDNWDYLIHYIFNRGAVRDGTKVAVDDAVRTSPLDHFYLLIVAVGQYLGLRELKVVLSPSNLSAINRWLKEQPFWQAHWSAYPDFETLLDHLTEA